MGREGSITNWFRALKEGDHQGARMLWERFSGRLLGLARKQLLRTPRQVADEEDVVLSAFASFCRGIEKGQFTQLQDREDIWHLLVTITVRKAIDQCNYHRRQKRGGDRTADVASLEDLLSREPSPLLAAILAEECSRLMALLGDDELRSIVLLKLEAFTDDAIARQLGCTRRTVQRRLRLIREIWNQESP